MKKLVFREVDRETWADFAGLFESRGGPKYCWCMAWRAAGAEAKLGGGAPRRAALKARIDAGTAIGILGYQDGAPIAWCSVAPRESFRPLGGPDAKAGEKVWSLTCFFIKRAFRGQGLTRLVLKAAIDHARRKGATVLEAYPVDPDSPSYRFMGFVETFDEAGFASIGRAGSRRHVMRLQLASAPR